MPTIELAGKTYEVDEDGFLQELDKWTEEFAQACLMTGDETLRRYGHTPVKKMTKGDFVDEILKAVAVERYDLLVLGAYGHKLPKYLKVISDEALNLVRLTTRPVRFSGKHLFVNSNSAAGELRIEVLDLRGQAIATSAPIRSDNTLQQVRWKTGGDLGALAGKPVKFRFYLRHAKLYSFWVSPDRNGASHGYVAGGGPGFDGPTDTAGSAAGAARQE